MTANAPNVVMILFDDTGFAQFGSFGSGIETPNIDRLAANGLRYNRFHVTALCSPTRACLMTGRNHHAVGMGFLADMPMTFPGYSCAIPKSAAALPRILRDGGYNTLAVGKWHLAPRHELTAAGPFDHWPLGIGFERYYGFLGGDTNQWTPNLVCDNHYIDPPRRPEDGYHLTEDLADQAIRMVQDQQQANSEKPFFLYFSLGAMHAPHHVAPEWIERYRGRFDHGWERYREEVFARQVERGVVPRGTVLTPRPSWVQAWDELSVDEQRVFARMHEVFAGFLSHTDAQIGRLLGALETLGVLDDTVVLLLSDNGTSAEGGRLGSLNEHRFTAGIIEELEELVAHMDDLGGWRAYNHYAWGWAWAGNTPLRLWKRYTWLGGTRVPLIVHWPRVVTESGAVRSHFCHAIDLAPTIFDLAGIEAPIAIDGVTQQTIDGASIRETFTDGAAPEVRNTQYFEMLGSRALYHDGWKATTDHVSQGVVDEMQLLEGSRDLDRDRWHLFRLADDFSEAVDVAAEHPDVLRHLQELWWAEAGRNNVLPIEDSLVARVASIAPAALRRLPRIVYRPGGTRVDDGAVPMLFGGFTLSADVEVADAATLEGVICAQGDWINGWALYVRGGRPVYALSAYGEPYRIAADKPLPDGRSTLRLEYERSADGGGAVRLVVGDDVLGERKLPRDLPFVWQHGGAGLTIGYDRGFPVSDDYETPFPFTATLHEVVIETPAAGARPSRDAILEDALKEE